MGLKPKGKTPETIAGRRQTRFLSAAISRHSSGANVEPFYACDYFDQIYDYAVQLIKRARPSSAICRRRTRTHIAARRTVRARTSPFRNRTVEENLDLFARMKAGEFPDGARTLRAKIDMASPNIWLRDPLLYRIRHAEHHHTGDEMVHLSDV